MDFWQNGRMNGFANFTEESHFCLASEWLCETATKKGPKKFFDYSWPGLALGLAWLGEQKQSSNLQESEV